MSVLSRILQANVLMFSVLFVAAPALAQRTGGAERPDAVKGAQLYDQGDAARGIVACAVCHGVAGNSDIPENPNLAALSHEYLAKQLTDFQVKPGADAPVRNGVDGFASPMTAMVQDLTPQDIQNVALYLAQQPLTQPATATDENLVELGQKIWRGGLPERNVPACAACHSANGAGIPAQYPRLSGQFPSYIAAQLKLFRDKDRANNAAMNDIANRLSDAEIKAVSDYAAGLR